MVACESCSPIMKKCIQCRTQIEHMVPLSLCRGGEGDVVKVSKIKLIDIGCIWLSDYLGERKWWFVKIFNKDEYKYRWKRNGMCTRS